MGSNVYDNVWRGVDNIRLGDLKEKKTGTQIWEYMLLNGLSGGTVFLHGEEEFRVDSQHSGVLSHPQVDRSDRVRSC